MPIEWRNVYSSSAAKVGHDAETGELYVEWANNGKISVYEDVSSETFSKLSKAPSVGTMIRNDIAPKHKHRYAAQ